MVKELKLGNNKIKNNIFLAPIAGYTNYAFRSLALKLGYGLCFTELVSAKGLVYKNNGTKELLLAGDGIKNTAVQLFGSDPYFLRKACESEELKDFDIVDINMGCPVPKVYKNGEGSALLTDINRAEQIIRECVKSGKTITIKIRKGIKEGDDVATDFALMAENAGAKLITIHARVKDAYYSGEPDYNSIYKAKKAVNIPVIANGGIFTKEDAFKMFTNTGADGIMLARGGIDNLFLVCELLNINPPLTKKEFIFSQLQIMEEVFGKTRANAEFRKFIPYYFKGERNIKEVKKQLTTAENINVLKELLNKVL
ncbi:MAG: tRNA-dihydrouridine synthase family protein [Clostridia bacterium]|nr:tRNA-dihydrouridine synthase family protein [Clostridia bacterium]